MSTETQRARAARIMSAAEHADLGVDASTPSEDIVTRMRYLRGRRKKLDTELKKLRAEANRKRREIDDATVSLAALAAELRRRR